MSKNIVLSADRKDKDLIEKLNVLANEKGLDATAYTRMVLTEHVREESYKSENGDQRK